MLAQWYNEGKSLTVHRPMRKLYWIGSLVLITFALFIFQVLPSLATDDGLALTSPGTCPPQGCAAGQRLNFSVTFPLSIQGTDPNTKVCVYAPAEGQATPGESPLASAEHGWISKVGKITGQPYQQVEQGDLCTDHMDDDDEWLMGAYATIESGTKDRLEFALHIHKDAEIDGYIKVKVLEAEQSNASWKETASYQTSIDVAKRAETVYVAHTTNDCGAFTPCYINSADDLKDGLGTGLRDAVMALDEGQQIRILKNYRIKAQAVLVDKQIAITGTEDSMITYSGTQCTNPMLILNGGTTVSNLTINDDNCSSPSRDLIEVDSDSNVNIFHNTLTFGNHAISIRDTAADVTIAFNHIVNNDQYAVFKDEGDTTGEVYIYANNFINNNQSGFQVRCNDHGIANHNFWGQGQFATDHAAGCSVSNAKRLGAAISLVEDRPGVQAVQLPVSTEMTYAFNDSIGARRTTGEDYDLIIVNHGQGSLTNIPFYQSGPVQLQACSNYYDIFLAPEAAAEDLVLTFKYDLTPHCVAEVESEPFCGGTNNENYPLWWYDPGNNVTDGWDRTGQNPQGPGAGGASGQETTCDLDTKEIHVIIDNTGRPSISSDLNFTPFVVGLPIVDGITLSEFTAQFDGSKVNLSWTTSSETNIKGYYVLRGNTETGEYSRVSSLINAIGAGNIGGTYQYTDETITFAKSYYYKIEVVDNQNNAIAAYGPVSILTATATPTATPTAPPTHTPTSFYTGTNTPISPAYPINTQTPVSIIYNTPTPFVWRSTATPSGGPTPIRTSFVPNDPIMAYPVADEIDQTDIWDDSSDTTDFPPDSSYPVDWEEPPPIDAYPLEDIDPTPSPSPSPDLAENDTVTPDPGGVDDEEERPAQNFQWVFIIVGGAVGLGVIGAVSVILGKTNFS